MLLYGNFFLLNFDTNLGFNVKISGIGQKIQNFGY